MKKALVIGAGPAGLTAAYGNLSMDAQNICRAMLLMMAFFMPLWTYVNTQLAVCRAGGDTRVGFLVDGGATAAMVPLLLIMAFFTSASPITMYFAVKVLDVGKIMVANHELKKEREAVIFAVPVPVMVT